jgi:hypothetical protein
MSDVNVSGTPAEATPSAPAPAAATPAAPAAPAVAAIPTTVTPQAPATGAAPEGWVPSYRIRETREAAIREANERFQTEQAQIRAEADHYRNQLQRLVGVTPPPDPQVSAVRDQFGQLYPGLAKLEERANDLMGLIERAGDLESQNSHYWQSYGRQTMDSLFKHAQDTVGTPLTDEAKRVLHSSFVGFVQSSPELTARYANDPTIVEDFWKAFSSSFIDPSRRAATATVAGRAAQSLPQDTPSGAPRAAAGPQPANLDERAASAWALYQQNTNKG